jgi:hypothetical protein
VLCENLAFVTPSAQQVAPDEGLHRNGVMGHGRWQDLVDCCHLAVCSGVFVIFGPSRVESIEPCHPHARAWHSTSVAGGANRRHRSRPRAGRAPAPRELGVRNADAVPRGLEAVSRRRENPFGRRRPPGRAVWLANRQSRHDRHLPRGSLRRAGGRPYDAHGSHLVLTVPLP